MNETSIMTYIQWSGAHLRAWFRKNWFELLIIGIGLTIIHLVFLSTAFRRSHTIDPESAAQFGEFVGGYIGSFFALTGAVLLYATFKANREASRLEHFETKYFELLKMHRDNVAELDIQRTSGRRIFVLMIRELRCVMEILRRTAQQLNQKLTHQQVLHIAYYCLFYGVGPNSSRILKMSLPTFNSTFIDALEQELNLEETKRQVKVSRRFGYMPFEGHQSRLGHYYRHLYQMIGYVDRQKMTDGEKYEYVKTIRAQLSTHEQALLLVNSLTPIGENWWRKGLIVKYRLVQNIPNEFFDNVAEINVNTLFEYGYFEWQEVGAS